MESDANAPTQLNFTSLWSISLLVTTEKTVSLVMGYQQQMDGQPLL
jgi:hypothetical protein